MKAPEPAVDPTHDDLLDEGLLHIDEATARAERISGLLTSVHDIDVKEGQRILGVTPDGLIGQKTINAFVQYAGKLATTVVGEGLHPALVEAFDEIGIDLGEAASDFVKAKERGASKPKFWLPAPEDKESVEVRFVDNEDDDEDGEVDRVKQTLRFHEIVLSGRLSQTRAKVKAQIEAHGGHVTSTVSFSTKFVVKGKLRKSESAKLVKAEDYGIEIIDEAEFRRRMKG
jgi:NAD-dependent DNA ligase